LRRFAILFFLFAAGLSACGSSASFLGSPLEEPLETPDFVLTNQFGQSFRLGDQRGKVVLFFFGYTQCPDVCPTTLATWRQVHQALGDDADRALFAFVTVDPERDTPEKLGLHVNAFNPDFVGLSGTPEQLTPIYEFFNIFFEKDTSSGSAAGYLISHTATSFVVDTEGMWRLRETYGTPAEDIAHDIRILLK
jgi:protein SCO1/2